MIIQFLILGVLQVCQSLQWNLNYARRIDGHGFGMTGLDYPYNSVRRINGLPFGETAVSHNSVNHWNHNSDAQGWNPVSVPSEQKSPIEGLEAWLHDIVIAKNDRGFVKPTIKEIGIPVRKDVEISIPYPKVKETAQPYPILIPMLQPVPFEVIKTVVNTVERKVPTKIEKIVPVPQVMPVPYELVKHVPVFVDKKIAIKIPIYKTIHHKIH